MDESSIIRRRGLQVGEQNQLNLELRVLWWLLFFLAIMIFCLSTYCTICVGGCACPACDGIFCSYSGGLSGQHTVLTGTPCCSLSLLGCLTLKFWWLHIFVQMIFHIYCVYNLWREEALCIYVVRAGFLVLCLFMKTESTVRLFVRNHD